MSKAVALFLCTTMVLPMASYYGNVSPVYGQEVVGESSSTSEKVIIKQDIKVTGLDPKEEIRLKFETEGDGESGAETFYVTPKNGKIESLSFTINSKAGVPESNNYKVTVDGNKYVIDSEENLIRIFAWDENENGNWNIIDGEYNEVKEIKVKKISQSSESADPSESGESEEANTGKKVSESSETGTEGKVSSTDSNDKVSSGSEQEVNEKKTDNKGILKFIHIFEGKNSVEDTSLEFTFKNNESNKIEKIHLGNKIRKAKANNDEILYQFALGDTYTISLAENDKYTMEPVEVEFKVIPAFNSPDLYIKGTDTLLSELQLKSKPEGAMVTLADISVVDFEGKPFKEGTEFEVYNMSDKRFLDTYKVKDGKLSGIKMVKGVRYKIGPKDLNTYTMIKKDVNAPFNYINLFARENNELPVETDLLGQKTDGEVVSKLKVITNDKLKGSRPEKAIYKDVSVILSDISKKDRPLSIDKDKITFDIYGAGTVQRVTSENGMVSFKMAEGLNYVAKMVISEKHNYNMDAFGIKLSNEGKLIKTSDSSLVETFNLFQGRYMIRMFVLDDMGYMVKKGQKFEVKGDDGSIQKVENVPGWLTFRADRDVNYTITMPENPSYKMDPIKFSIRRYKDTYTALLDGSNEDRLTHIPIERKDKSSNPNEGMERIYDPAEQYEVESDNGGGCGGGDCLMHTEKISTPSIELWKGGSLLNDEVSFTLFNSTRQRYEGKVVAKDGKLPKLNLTAKTKYILMLENSKYYMPNVYFKTGDNGQKVYNFKDKKIVDSIVLYDRDANDPKELRTDVSIKTMYKGNELNEKIKFQLVSAFETLNLTSENGVIKAALKEDETYVVKALSDKYELVSFPLVIKDKSEYQTPEEKSVKYKQNKLPFNHSTCDYVSKIELLDKGEAQKQNTTIQCPSGKTHLSGMKFNNLQISVESLDKKDFPSLSARDVKIFNFNLMNPFRCEVSKIATGNFKIKRDLEDTRAVSRVFYITDNGSEKELSFTQDGKFINVDVDSISLYPMVVEYGTSSRQGSSSAGVGSSSASIRPSTDNKKVQKDVSSAVSRMAGRNRELTAVEISKETFKNGADNVVLVNGYATTDALAALPYAKHLNGPVLLMGRARMSNEVKAEIARLGAKNITIIGGTSSVEAGFVEGQFKKLNISRISGRDRYETSINIAKKYMDEVGNSKKLIMASGTGIVDALSVANLGDIEMGPVVLTRPNQMTSSLESLIKDKDIKEVLMLGGASSISKGTESDLRNKNVSVNRISGRNRYATSIELAKKFSTSKHLVVANGSDKAYVDALSVGLYAYKNKAGVVITDQANSKLLEDYIKSAGIKSIKLVGGGSSISTAMENSLRGLLK